MRSITSIPRLARWVSLMNSRLTPVCLALLLPSAVWLFAAPSSAAEKPAPKLLPKTLPDELKLSPAPVAREQFVYQYLLSEIAGQRGIGSLAAQGMLDLATRTRDAKLARRATEIAFEAQKMGEAREALMVWLAIEPDA
jgi:hypothetical protein